MTIESLKNMVEVILKDFEEARNDDRYLTWQLWCRFYYIQDSIDYKKYSSLPMESEIGRIRRDFQNDQKKYLPTRIEVAKARGWKEDEWRIALGYKLDLQ